MPDVVRSDKRQGAVQADYFLGRAPPSELCHDSPGLIGQDDANFSSETLVAGGGTGGEVR